jgi:Antitoxin-like ribbon-helix-helix
MMKKPSLFQTPSLAPAAPTSLESDIGGEPYIIATRRPPSREGKRVLSVYLPPEAWKQLRMLAVNLETSTQDLGEQAINMLFEAHRLNRIA